jgi:hypothetical protein
MAGFGGGSGAADGLNSGFVQCRHAAVADDTAARFRLAESPRVGPKNISFKWKAAERDQIALAYYHLIAARKTRARSSFVAVGSHAAEKRLLLNVRRKRHVGSLSAKKF